MHTRQQIWGRAEIWSHFCLPILPYWKQELLLEDDLAQPPSNEMATKEMKKSSDSLVLASKYHWNHTLHFIRPEIYVKYHSNFPLYPKAQTLGKGISLQPTLQLCYSKFHAETESKAINLTNALLNTKNAIQNRRHRNWHTASSLFVHCIWF